MKPLIVIVVIVVGLMITGGIIKALKPVTPQATAASTCELPGEMHPSELILLVGSKKQEHQSMYASLVGCMVPAGGWEGQVTGVDGNTMRFEVGTGFGSYVISVAMRETPSVQAGSVVKYRGRLDSATARVVMGNILNRIELSEGEIVP